MAKTITKSTFLDKEYFKFFMELARNNQKTWFDENRTRYHEVIKIPFENLVQSILEKFAKKDKSYADLKASDCIFRINRDIRFSKDKTPYKLNRSAVIVPGGRKNMILPGFYFEIGAESSVCYTGSYQPEPEQLLKIRNKIAQQPKEFEKIINNKVFKTTWGEIQGEKNKKLSPELTEAAVNAPLIYNKQFYCVHEFDPELAIKTGFDDYIIDVLNAAHNYNSFLTV